VNQALIPGRNKDFSTAAKLAVWPTQPTVQCVPVPGPLTVKWKLREEDRSPQLVLRLECVNSYFHYPIRLHGIVLKQAQEQLCFGNQISGYHVPVNY
jgi:hypothetical protein